MHKAASIQDEVATDMPLVSRTGPIGSDQASNPSPKILDF